MIGNSAIIDVRVPPNAQIWFEDQPTTQAGTFREFISPPLEPDRTFTYDVRARWMENGRPVERTRHINVHAGDQLNVDFRAQTGGEEIGQPGARQDRGTEPGSADRQRERTGDRDLTPRKTPRQGAAPTPNEKPQSDKPPQ